MKASNRRFYAMLGGTSALVIGGVAATIVVVFSGGGSSAGPTRAQYFARVAVVCRTYGAKLDKIPAPADIAAPGEVLTSVQQALPILESQTRTMRALRPPDSLRSKVERWLALNDRVIAELRSALLGARRRDIGAMGGAFIRYRVAGLAARKLGAEIGFPSTDC